MRRFRYGQSAERLWGVVASSQLFLLEIALAREFIGQLKRLESSWLTRSAA